MNINDLLECVSKNNDIEKLAEDIKIVLSDIFDISEINILYFDSDIQKLKNVLKNFEPAQDYFSEEKINILNEIFNKLKVSNFVINDDINLPDEVLDSNIIVKTISSSLRYQGDTVGLVRLKFRTKFCLTEKSIEIFSILGNILSLKVMNIVLSKQMEIKSEFYKSMKDIAKIIETQYDFQYIIPLIGEMIDKFVMNHLIYIFIKKEGKYNLYWPGACWNQKIYELIEFLNPNDGFLISEDKKTGAFPLISEGEIIGCIVAHSSIDKLDDSEIDYIDELTKQSAITIERANTYSEILQNATMDALTGLNNRRQFEVRLKEQYAIANRQNTPLCAIMTDIDFFKKFNDTYGHATGDTVLKETANVIKENLREYDIASRYGGEEFCIILPQTNIEEAKIVAERLRSAVENIKISSGNKKIQVTISVGLSELDIKDMPEDLYMKADRALYDAKEGGRNRVAVYHK